MSLLGNIFGSSDEQAMWRVQMHDDSEAFAQLLGRWEGPIKRLCTRMLGDVHRAEDLTQEAFAKVYSKRKDYQHGGKFSTFLWRVATNLCLDEIRRIKRRREFSLLPQSEDGSEAWEKVPSGESSPDNTLVAEEQAALVRRMVNQLPEHYRAVVVLRHYENLKFREIAEVLEVPIGTVKSRMSEALTLLNQLLKKNLKEQGARWHEGPCSNQKESLIL